MKERLSHEVTAARPSAGSGVIWPQRMAPAAPRIQRSRALRYAPHALYWARPSPPRMQADTSVPHPPCPVLWDPSVPAAWHRGYPRGLAAAQGQPGTCVPLTDWRCQDRAVGLLLVSQPWILRDSRYAPVGPRALWKVANRTCCIFASS